MKTACLVFLALLAVATAVPASVKRWDSYVADDSLDSCAAKCTKQTSKFSYKTYTTYIYDYVVDTDTSMAGASEESAKLSIKARAEIQALDSCDFALLLKDVRVSHTDAYTGRLRTSAREDEFQQALEGSTLRFAFNDGVISSVCPESSETTWALNFKRGLLSAFQNSMESLDKSHRVSEVDVTGECDADFTIASSWAWKKETRISKTKNLLACSKRDSYRSMYQIIPYSVNSEIQSMPIMKSTHKCDYVISSSQVLQSVSCEETHMFVPFSNQESGGKTKVQQKLTLVSQKDGVEAVIDPVKERLSLLFEHDDSTIQAQNGAESLEQKLKEICDQTNDDIRPETPRLYSELVQIIKVLSKSDLERTYKLVKDKIICPKNGRTLKFFMDALPMAATEGSISLMTSLINSRQVEGTLAKAWLTSLALVQEPTSSMAEDGLKLLKGPFYSDALLPVSALVNKFCQTSISCENDYYISQILTFLPTKIPSSCNVDDANLKEVLKTLRAVGNIGQSVLTSALDSCVRSTSSSLEVKVAAADAYRRMPCDAPFGQRDGALWAVLQDQNQDTELRITSYLSVMRCPDDDTLTQVSQLLDTEVDDHLGGFIYSHVKNLKETSDPLKQDIAKTINQHTFKEFKLNLFKYSSNHEASVLINRLNMGFTADSNVLMSSNSPLPRSAMLNLTVDIFGNSINLLEIGGRVEGLEILVEKLLGPTGYFPTKADKRGDDKLNDVKGSIYARVFGHEVFFEQAKGTQGVRAPSNMPNFLDILISFANRQAVAYTYSQQLMDVSLTVPTVAGLPLEITVNGSMNLDLKAEGKADLRKVATSPRSMEIDGEFRPSAALEVTGTMAVVALSTRMGLRMRNTMHSSTWLKGHIEIDRGHVLKIEIDPPGDKMEIFNARSQFFIIHDEVEKEQNMIKDNYQEYKLCSGDKLATVIGVELCGEVKFPNASYHEDSPYFPLTGPTSLSIMTYRRDTHTSYKVLAMRKETKDRSTAQFLMDTPNSKVNRMISTDISIGYTPDKQIDISLVSPWKKLNLNSAVVANKGIVSFVGSVLLDDRDKYGLTTEVKISNSGSNVAYTPFIELTQGGKTDTLLSGLVNVDLPNKLDANLEVKGLEMLPYTVEGGLINQEKEKRVRLSLSKEGKSLYVLNVGSTIDISGKDNRNVKVEPTLLVKTQDQTLVSITGSSDYKHEKSADGDLTVEIYKMKPASVAWKISQTSKGKQANYDVELKMKSSLLTGTIDGDVSHQRHVLSSKLKVNYNIPKFGTDVVMWTTKFTNKSKNTFLKYQIVSNLDMTKFTDYNAGLNVRLDHKKNKQTDVDVDLKYGANSKDKKKVVTFNSSLKTGSLSWKNADLGFELKATAPEKNVDLNMKMGHVHSSTKLDSTVNLKFRPYLKNVVDAGISLEDKNIKLLSYNGQAHLGIMGKKIAVSSDLTQKSAKHYQHVLDLQDFDGNSHLINTAYTSLGSNGHEITSDVNINGYNPVLLQGKTILDLSNFQASGSAVYGKDLYNVSTQSKFTNSANKLNFALVYPSRQVEAEAEVKYQKEKVSSSFSVDWDAKRSSKSKVSVESSYRNSVSKDSIVVSGTVDVKTPFTNLEDLSADASFSSDPAQYSTKGKVSWGGKQETVSSSLVVKRPLSLSNVEITFVAATPIRQYREIELEVSHKFDQTLASSAKGKLEDSIAELTVKGENRGDLYNQDFLGFVEVKTPFAVLRDASVSLEHKDNGRSFKSVGFFGHNSRKYQADLQMDHASSRSGVDNNGKLLLSWPEDQLQTTWQHSLQGVKQIKSSLESKWSGNNRVVIDLVGSNSLERNLRHIQATLNVQTPWRNSREITVKLDNRLKSDRLESSASFLSDKVEKIVYSVLLEQNNRAGNVIFMLISPLYDHKIHGQTEIKWDSYPVTALAWLEWAPWARIDFDGSLNVPSMFDIELNTKLTTPFKSFENIIAGASHKLENLEYVSRVTVNYSVRKMINFENRLRFDDDVKLLRTKLTTPFSNLRSFNTGLRLNTNSYKVEGSADFELLPLVLKYDGFVTWNYDPKNWNGKLRLNTPLRQMPYFQIVSWSKKGDNNIRVSHLDVEPSSYGVYSLDSSYKLPLQLDITIKTPHPQFDSFGLAAMYNPSLTSLESKLRVMYQLNKAVESQLKLDWSDNYEGSLVVTTPFSSYENNKIIARHDSSKRGFTSHGEASVGGENVQADVTYTSSPSTTSGSASLSSSLKGFEKLSTIFNIKGTLNRLQADASVNTETNILATTFSNNVSPGLLKSSLTVTSLYTEVLKLSIQHKDSSSYSETTLESSFDGQYGNKGIDGKMGLSYAGLKKAKVDLSLNTIFKSGQVSLENTITADRVSGKGSIQTDIEAIGNVEVSYDKNGPLNNMVSTVSVIRNGQSLAKTVVEINIPGDSLRVKIGTEGILMPTITALVDHRGIISDFSTKTTVSDNQGNSFDNEVTFKIEDSLVDLRDNLNLKYNSVDLSHVMTIHKEGTLTDFKVDVSSKLDDDEVTAALVFQAENQIKGSIEVNNLSSRYDKIGAEFEHNGDSEKFITTGKITISSSEDVSGKVNFYRHNLKRIEATAELNTPWQGYRYSRAEYRHEGGDDRLSCSMNIQYGDGQKFSSDLITQHTPLASSLTLNLKTPFKGYEDLLLSGDFDSSKIDGNLVLGTGMVYTISGVYDPSAYPYHIQYQITTPLEVLKKATLNLKGTPLDGTVDLVVVSLNKKVEGNGVFQYTSPYKLSLSTQMTSNIQGFTALQLNIKNDDDGTRGKTSHLLVSWDPIKQVVVDGRWLSGKKRWTSKQENVLELNVRVPFEKFQSIGLNIEHNADTDNVQGVVSLEVDQKKLVDVDINYDRSSKYAYSAVIRKPWPMEYTTSFQYDDYTKEGDVFVNWNRDDPSSNLRIKSSLQNRPSDNDKSVTLTYTSPSRTMGVEHSLASSADKLTSSGKLFWDQDDDSKLSYSLDVSSNNRRRDTAYTGDFKLGFPSRTLGLSGSLSKNDLATTGGAAISWDLGRDDSKRLEMQATFSGKEFTKADISVKLPSQNLQVTSALILNQGNTILDGKTDISYSREARKTLTLFSKLRNTPTSYSYFSNSGNSFNYSVELGVSHPETKVDVKIDSHVASSDEFLTSSLGVKYMTVRRQMKNLALFAEIDKIRKQISLVASGPTRSAGVSGKLVSDEPLSLVVLSSLDGQEKWKSTLDVDVSRKIFKFDIGQPDNLLSLKTYYPNSSAIQTDLFYQNKQEALVGLRLLNSRLLHSRIYWRPAAIGELVIFVTEQISAASKNTQDILRQVNVDLRAELSGKYDQVTSSVVEDLKPLLKYAGDELESFATDLDNVRLRLSDMHRDNEFFLQDITNAAIVNYDYASDALTTLKEELQQLVSLYRDTYRSLILTLLEKLDKIQQYSFLNSYNQVVTRGIQDLVRFLDGKIAVLVKSLRETDLQILERTEALLSNVGDLYNHPQLDFIKKRIEQLRNIDYNYYADWMNDAMRNSIDLDKYTSALNSLKDVAVNTVIPERVRDMAERATNELYQQAQLAYKHWDIEENFNKHMNISVELLKDIVEDEIREYINLLLIRNPVTLFDPDNGRIEANFILPVEVKYLDRLPDMSSYIQQATDLYNKYAPDMDTFSKYTPKIWSKTEDLSKDLSNTIPEDTLLDDFATFKPSKSLKNRYAYKS